MKYNWNTRYRERIIALCFLSSWYSRFGLAIIRPEYFETDEEQEVVKFLIAFYKSYRRPPEEDEILAEFHDYPEAQDLIENVMEYLDEDLTYPADMAVQFAKEQAMKLAILDSVQDIEKGKLSSIIDRVKAALAVGRDLTELGIDIKNITEWLPEDDETEKITTGIPLLDAKLQGGLARKEYGVVMAATNVGKTQLLVNFGFGALNPLVKANVVHISLEMSAKLIARRYGARIVGAFFQPDEKLSDYVADFRHMHKLRVYGQLRIRSWPSGMATLNDIRSYLDMLITTGFHPDLLIIDYPDIMHHERIGEHRHNISNTSVQIRGLADTYDIAIWGASQTNRSALNSEIVDLDAIAEDYGKVQIADVVLPISQTRQEYEDGLLRIYGGKVRNGPKHWQIRCEQYLEGHAVLGLEEITMKDLLEERRNRREEKDILGKLKDRKDSKAVV